MKCYCIHCQKAYNEGFLNGYSVGHNYGYVDGYVDRTLNLPPPGIYRKDIQERLDDFNRTGILPQTRIMPPMELIGLGTNDPLFKKYRLI